MYDKAPDEVRDAVRFAYIDHEGYGTRAGHNAAADVAYAAGLAEGRCQLDDARRVARGLVHMEREHLGTGPEGHLSERDLAPLLHALTIDPEETDRG